MAYLTSGKPCLDDALAFVSKHSVLGFFVCWRAGEDDIEEVAHRVIFGFMSVFMWVFQGYMQDFVVRHMLVVLALLAGS